MALTNPELVSKIESLNLEEERDPILIQVEAHDFPVVTSAHKLTLEDGQVVEAVRSK
jgi:hypothetical protein